MQSGAATKRTGPASPGTGAACDICKGGLQMEFGVPSEARSKEYRVGLTPAGVDTLTKSGHTVYVERGAGAGAGFDDEDYRAVGARLVYQAEEVWWRAQVVVKVTRPTAAARLLPEPDGPGVLPLGRVLAGPARRTARSQDDGHRLRDDPGGRRDVSGAESDQRGGRAAGADYRGVSAGDHDLPSRGGPAGGPRDPARRHPRDSAGQRGDPGRRGGGEKRGARLSRRGGPGDRAG